MFSIFDDNRNEKWKSWFIILLLVQIKKSDNTKHWRVCKSLRPLMYCWWECKLLQSLWKTVISPNIEYSHIIQSSIPFLSMHHRNILYIYNGIHVQQCSSKNNWKQPECPSKGEYIYYDTFSYLRYTPVR